MGKMYFTKQSMCGRKKKHRTLFIALVAMISNHGVNDAFNAYQCKFCNHFHVGHVVKP